MSSFSDWIIEWLFCNSTGYPGKDAYPPPGYPAQGYPPPGYPPQSYAPQYAQQPPPRQEVGFLEGWYVSLSLSSSYYVLILFPFSLVLLEFFGIIKLYVIFILHIYVNIIKLYAKLLFKYIYCVNFVHILFKFFFAYEFLLHIQLFI